MSDNKPFDFVVLGGGPGGYTAAFRAADLGLSVCLIEQRERLGGVCLNVGCIPSKTLLHASAVIEEAREIDAFGVHFDKPRIDPAAMRAKKIEIITKLTGGLDSLAKARKITRLTGRGVFQDENTLMVESAEGETEVRFKNCVIATGSRPFNLPGMVEDDRIWDSTAALELRNIPERLLVIGGGIIGLEMAQVYSGLGSAITIVEMLDHIIPPADKDMVQPLFQKLKKDYSILTGAKVIDVREGDDGLEVTIESKKGLHTDSYDNVLVAVGRRPNSGGIGLEKIGLAMDDRGFIEVDEKQRTAVSGIYAIGDVVGDPMLAHKATHQGKVAAEHAADHEDAVFSPLTIPSVAYTSPEVAWMGMTEKEARKKGIDYDKGKFSWGASGRAMTSGAPTGASKVLFSRESGKIIGAGICGQNAGELIHEAVLALQMGCRAEDVAKTVHAHPTLMETFALACEIVDGSITDGLPPKRK